MGRRELSARIPQQQERVDRAEPVRPVDERVDVQGRDPLAPAGGELTGGPQDAGQRVENPPRPAPAPPAAPARPRPERRAGPRRWPEAWAGSPPKPPGGRGPRWRGARPP